MNQHNRSAKRYAKALFDLAEEKKQLETIFEELKAIRQLMVKTDLLKDFLNRPTIDEEKRKTVIEALFKEKVNRLTYNFILFLGQKGKLFLLEEVCEIFENMYLTANNILRAEVVSAQPLEQAQVQTIGQRLKSKLNKDVLIHCAEDVQMIGGFKVKIADIVYDFSLTTQLERFQRSVTAA